MDTEFVEEDGWDRMGEARVEGLEAARSEKISGAVR
jgi:hypothetical protein